MAVLIQHQLGLPPLHVVGEGDPVGLIHLAVARFHRAGGAVGGGGVHVQDEHLVGDGALQGGEIHVVAALGLGEEEVLKQNGGLAPGDGAGGVQVEAVGERDGAGGAEIAVVPHGAHAHVGVLIAQDAHEDGDRLRAGDGPVGVEAAGGVAPYNAGSGDGALSAAGGASLGGHGHVAAGPVGGGHVGKDGAVHLGGDLVAVAHDLHRHLAELGPGQGAARLKIAGAGAADDAQQPEDLRRLGGRLVGDVGEGGGLPGCGGGQDQQSYRQRTRQHQGQKTFDSHV